MPKLPSLQQLFRGFVAVIRRFPLEILASIIGTVATMILTEKEGEYTSEQVQVLVRIILCSILALSLLLSVSVYVEEQKISWRKSLTIRIPALALIVLFFFLLHPIDNTTNIFRFGFLFVAFHLLVSFAPFIRNANISAFWEYNKRLFLRILTAGLYSSVLHAGLSIAIVSTDVLFNLDLDGKIYVHLGCFIFGIFNTAFFLAGVPNNWQGLESEQSYPKGLKIFTQFVLIPLAVIYLMILLTYEGKVVVEWSLPKGVVSTLVLGYAVYGILSILLVHPIRHQHENKWIRTFSNLFYFLLIPLIALLCVAIWARLQQYGVTEPRYIVIVLSVWLIGITAYFLISKSENIKVIPVSLCILTLACIWGPQSASSISLNSQTQRLLAFFQTHNAFKDGKLVRLDDSKKSNEGWEIISFIVEHYGKEPLRQYLTVNIDSLTYAADTIKLRYQREDQQVSLIRNYLNLKREYDNSENYAWHYFQATADIMPVAGYSYMKEIYYYGYTNSDAPGKWDPKLQTFSLNINSLYIFDLTDVTKKITESGKVQTTQDNLILVDDQDRKAKLIIKYLSIKDPDSPGQGYHLESIRGYLLMKEHPNEPTPASNQ